MTYNVFFISSSFICALIIIPAQAADYISHQLKNNRLLITTSQGDVALTPYGEQALEVLYQAEQKQLPSFAIADTAATYHFQLKNNEQSLEFSSDKFIAVIEKSPLNIRYFTKDSNQKTSLLLAEEQGFFSHDNAQGFRFTLSDNEKLIGGGERVLGMDRRGKKMPLYNKAHYGYTTQSNQMYFGLPAVLSTNKYILLFDNSAKGEMDLGATTSNIMQFEAVSGRSAYIVFAGDSYPKLIQNYVEVTGKQPLPPRWAFGNYASRFGYKSEQEVRDTVNKFIEEDFPLDALVLDLYWFGKDVKGHMGNLAWDNSTFPQPTAMIKDIKALGVNTIIITEPFVLSSSKKWHDAVQANALATTKTLPDHQKVKRFDFYFGNTGLIDIFNSQGQNWFKQTYKMLSDQGVAGWWGDLGEPEVHPSDTLHTFDDGTVVNADEIHNVYGHQWANMVFNQQLALQPNQRPFIMMRSGFAGSQRYGMIPWTGDVSRSWGGLKPQVELSLQMSLLGMAYTHSDLGGFAGGEQFDQEMYIRWLQYGVFQPVYRPHAQDNIAPEPIFHDQQTKDILREFVKLRYQLLPYNYTLAYQNSTTGMPLMRPMFFEDEQNIELIDNASSYFWGDAFLVTPIVNAGVKSVTVDLPQGVWFDYWSNKKYQGEQTIELATSLTTLPVLVRAGAFIPMVDSIQSTKDYSSKALTVHYYHDDSVVTAQGKMFEDDGKSYQSIAKGLYELLSFDAKQKLDEQQLILSIARQHQYSQALKNRTITFVIHNWLKQPNSVKMMNKQVSSSLLQSLSPNSGKNSGKNSAQKSATKTVWDQDKKTLTITFTWQHQPLAIVINK